MTRILPSRMLVLLFLPLGSPRFAARPGEHSPLVSRAGGQVVANSSEPRTESRKPHFDHPPAGYVPDVNAEMVGMLNSR